MTQDIIETSKSQLWLDDEGVIHFKYREGVTVHEEDAIREIAAVQTLLGGRRAPFMVDLRPLKAADAKARAYFAGDKTAQVSLGAAFLVESAVSRVLGNFFIGLNKPSYPVRLFTSETEALQWLKELAT